MTTCPNCDRRRATDEEWAMEAGEAPHACFGASDCAAHEVDWRARALAAERMCHELAATASAASVRRLLDIAIDERNTARLSLCRLLDAHMSSSDEVRRLGIAAAIEEREGWGM